MKTKVVGTGLEHASNEPGNRDNQSSKRDLVAEVKASLAGVVDPCSRHNGTHMSLTELGMIEDVVEASPGEIKIDLFLDDLMCIYMVDIHKQLRSAAKAVEGVKAVDIEVIGDRLWTPDRINSSARAKMDQWDRIRRERGFTTSRGGPVPVNILKNRPESKTQGGMSAT